MRLAFFVLSPGLLLASCQTSEGLSSVSQQANTRQDINTPLGPFKDSLFSYRTPLQIRDNGDYLVVPYNEQKDINARDELPVRKVRAGYTKKLPKDLQREFSYDSNGRVLKALGAGPLGGPAPLAVIYIHGKGGNRKWGFDDERFGGNYNRLKNLVAAIGGIYISPDFTNFNADGYEDIAHLIAQQKALDVKKIILACGSLGTKICWAMADKKESRAQLDGLVLLGGFTDRDFIRVAYSNSSPAIPLYIAHGSADKVYSRESIEDLYNALRTKDYPVRMTVFDTGNHGTPVRMIDWRQTINWILNVG